jgi:transglutaminase-like putative cysteine protease
MLDRRLNSIACLFALLAAGGVFPGDAAAEDDAAPKSRHFRLQYGAQLTDLEPGAKVRIWLPVPPSNDFQQVATIEQDLPAEAKAGTEDKYGNEMLYLATKAGEGGTIPLRITYEVQRQEVRGLESTEQAEISDDEKERFLHPDRLGPIDGKPLELLEGLDLASDPLELGRQLYDRVNEHMRYSKDGTGWGQGDVLWACDSRYGNCTDFHSLFISLARSRGVPARFEMGFPVPPEHGEGKVGGYHCWAYFFVAGHGWVPVDISEADKNPDLTEYYFGHLTADRVMFSTGRDIDLVPKQDGPTLNYFIYPYVEVDGKPLAKDHIKLEFAYKDVE